MTLSPNRTWPPSTALGVAAAVMAVGLGIAVSHLDSLAVVVGLATLLPLASHVRWVGMRRAITEPTAITFILIFYLAVFPQRGLAITANQFTDVNLIYTVTSGTLASALLLASLGTTALVEAFHLVRSRPASASSGGTSLATQGPSVVPLATLLGALALVSLALIIVENNGISGTASAFLTHSKSSSQEARSFGTTMWAVVAVPAVWCAAYAAVDSARAHTVRVAFVLIGAVLVLAQVTVFGSRLNALLALLGAWVVVHYLGRSIPVAAVVASVPIVILLSVPIVSQRPGSDLDGLPAHERYSRIASYGVLDASLAVQAYPDAIRQKLSDPQRWVDLPFYLVPSPIWPDKPTLDDRRMDVYVAQTFGNRNQQDTGFPTTYITEWSLYGGWLAVLVISALLGALLGGLHRLLVGLWVTRRSPAAILWYCTASVAAFTYYKDGDLLTNLVGSTRTAFYLGLAMLVTGLLFRLPLGERGGRGASFEQAPSRLSALGSSASTPAG